MHAACVASDGRGVLIAGTSGSGKTTLSIALTQAGFDFLGDDLAFLVDNDGVVGFADEIDITPWTEALFPALGQHRQATRVWPRSKRSTQPREELLGVVPVSTCAPAAVVFPLAVPGTRPALRPVAPRHALCSRSFRIVLLTEQAATQTHVNALARLVETCPCYRLEMSADPSAAAGLVVGLMAR